MREEWKTCETPGYLVSNKGRVKNTKSKRILKNNRGPYGYYYVTMGNSNRRVTQLMAELFLEPAVGKAEARPINGDMDDLLISNWHWTDEPKPDYSNLKKADFPKPKKSMSSRGIFVGSAFKATTVVRGKCLHDTPDVSKSDPLYKQWTRVCLKAEEIEEDWLKFSNFYAWASPRYRAGFMVNTTLLGGEPLGPDTCVMLAAKYSRIIAQPVPTVYIYENGTIYLSERYLEEETLEEGIAKEASKRFDYLIEYARTDKERAAYEALLQAWLSPEVVFRDTKLPKDWRPGKR